MDETNEFAFDCFDNNDQVTISDVAEMLMMSFKMMHESSKIFKEVQQKLTKEEYVKLMNTISLTILSNLNIMSMTEDEQIEYANKIAKSANISSVNVFAMKKTFKA